jgi:hypothetical protein
MLPARSCLWEEKLLLCFLLTVQSLLGDESYTFHGKMPCMDACNLCTFVEREMCRKDKQEGHVSTKSLLNERSTTLLAGPIRWYGQDFSRHTMVFFSLQVIFSHSFNVV